MFDVLLKNQYSKNKNITIHPANQNKNPSHITSRSDFIKLDEINMVPQQVMSHPVNAITRAANILSRNIKHSY